MGETSGALPHETIGERHAGGLASSPADARSVSDRVLALASIVILCGAFIFSDGLYNIDELIYVVGAEALSNGRLTVDNGFDVYGAEALRLWLLVNGPDGLVPQYPPGMSFVGAVLMPVFGLRALILANAAGIVATLYLTRALARELYRSERAALLAALLFGFGTFALDYAYGIWPHGLAVACTTAAIWLAARSLQAGRDPDLGFAAGAGLALGIGVLFRIDAILVVPGIAASALLFAARPWRVIAAGVAGLLPAILILAAFNAARFGSFNPFSYGGASGGTDPARHLLPLALMAVAMLALLALRYLRPGKARVRTITVAALGALLAVLVVPEIAGAARKIVSGAYALLIDIRVLAGTRPSIVAQPDGTVLFWGLAKKALGQSLPWLGILAAIFARPAIPAERRGHAFLLLITLGIMLIFLMRSWHGGMSSNMRYFLPALPLLACLAAQVWWRLAEYRRPEPARLAALLAVGGITVTAWAASMPSGLAGAHQILPLILLLAVALAGLAATVAPKAGIPAVQALAPVALGAAVVLGPVGDLTESQKKRSFAAGVDAEIAAMDGPILFFGPVEFAASLAWRDDGLLATPAYGETGIDAELALRAARDGYRVLVPEESFDSLTESSHSADLRATPLVVGGYRMRELAYTPAKESVKD